MVDVAWTPAGTWRHEALLCRTRCGMAVLVAAMTILFDPAYRPVAALLAAFLVALSVVSARSCRVPGLWAARRLVQVVTAADAAVAIAIFLLFLPDPVAIPVALMPFVLLELSLRFGDRGAALGLAVFLLALGARVLSQLLWLHGPVRTPMLLVWTAVALLVTAIARQLRTEEKARLTALADRERIATNFQATVCEMLSRSAGTGAATRGQVLEALRRICDEGCDDAGALAALIAAPIIPRPDDPVLTARERQVVSLVNKGYSSGQIAALLAVSPSTVRNHIHHIKTKVEVEASARSPQPSSSV